jgi:hypothetical protein
VISWLIYISIDHQSPADIYQNISWLIYHTDESLMIYQWYISWSIYHRMICHAMIYHDLSQAIYRQYQLIYLSIIYLSGRLSIYLSISIDIWSIYLSQDDPWSIDLSIWSIYLSICITIYLYIYLSQYLSGLSISGYPDLSWSIIISSWSIRSQAIWSIWSIYLSIAGSIYYDLSSLLLASSAEAISAAGNNLKSVVSWKLYFIIMIMALYILITSLSTEYHMTYIYYDISSDWLIMIYMIHHAGYRTQWYITDDWYIRIEISVNLSI